MFVVEKYLKLVKKKDETNVPDYIKNRPNKLHGIVNLKDFKAFVNNNQSNDTKYSDCFGDLRFIYEVKIEKLRDLGVSLEELYDIVVGVEGLTGRQLTMLLKNPNNSIKFDGASLPQSLIDELGVTPVSVAGSTGIKYGIRVCFIPPSGFVGGNVSESRAMREKSLNVKQVGDPKRARRWVYDP